MEEVRDRVSRVIAKQFNVAEAHVAEGADFDRDLGATSHDHVEMIMALEDEFTIVISDDDASAMHTVADVIAYVTARVHGPTGVVGAEAPRSL